MSRPFARLSLFSRLAESPYVPIDYQVRIVLPTTLTATTQNPKSLLISTGDTIVRNLNFGLRLANRALARTTDAEFASILAALGFDDSDPTSPRRHWW
jgi:hypothetical protein